MDNTAKDLAESSEAHFTQDNREKHSRIEGSGNEGNAPKRLKRRAHAASFDNSVTAGYTQMYYQSNPPQLMNRQDTYAMSPAVASNQSEAWAGTEHMLPGPYYATSAHTPGSNMVYWQSTQQGGAPATAPPITTTSPGYYVRPATSHETSYHGYASNAGETQAPQHLQVHCNYNQHRNIAAVPNPLRNPQDLRRTHSFPAVGYRDSSGLMYHGFEASRQQQMMQHVAYPSAGQSQPTGQVVAAGTYGAQQYSTQVAVNQHGLNYGTQNISRMGSDPRPAGTPSAQNSVEVKKRGNEWTAEETIALLLFTKLMLDCDLKTISQALFSYISRAPGKSSGRAAEKKLKRMKIFKNWKGANKGEVQQNINRILQHYGVLNRQVAPRLIHVAMSFKEAETTGTIDQLIEHFAEAGGATRELFASEPPIWTHAAPV